MRQSIARKRAFPDLGEPLAPTPTVAAARLLAPQIWVDPGGPSPVRRWSACGLLLVGAWTLSVVRTDLSRMRLRLGCCVDHFLELLDGVKMLLDREAGTHGVDRDIPVRSGPPEGAAALTTIRTLYYRMR